MSERVQVSVRVPEKIKESYEEQITEKYDVKRPYAGIELEKELRINFGMGEYSGMYDSLRDLVDKSLEKEKIEIPTFTGGGEIVQYRIHSDVRAKLKELSYDTFGSMGSIVAKVMFHYSLGEGFQDQMRGYVKDLEEDGVQEDVPAKERKERDIAEYLRENYTVEDANRGEFVVFGIEDFDKAAKEAADLFTESHAREKYLKDVMERLGAKPNRKGTFNTRREAGDPRGLPYEAMDRGDMVTALRAGLLERGEGTVLTTDKEAETFRVPSFNPVDVLGKRPRNLESILKEVAESPGFNYKPPDSGRIDSSLVSFDSKNQAIEHVNSDDKALELAGLLEEPELKSDEVQDDPAKADTQKAEVIAD